MTVEGGGGSGLVFFRVLDYYFALDCPIVPLMEYVQHVLGAFVVESEPAPPSVTDTSDLPPRYRVVSADAPDRYRLLYGSEPLVLDDLGLGVLDHFFWHVNSEALRFTESFLVLHAGAVATGDGRAVLLPAVGGGGKSTMVAALVRAGFDYLTDEASAIDPGTGRIHPFPKALTLKAGSFALFPELERLQPAYVGRWHIRPEDLRPGSTTGPAMPGWVVGVRYEPGRAARLVPMTRGAMVVELWSHRLNAAVYGARSLPVLARLCAGSGCFSLVYSDLDEGVAAITALTSGG